MLFRILLLLLLPFFLNSCSVPAPSYNISTPLGLECSTDYNPNTPLEATWSDSCSSSAWIRFYYYSNAPDFTGWVLYFDTARSTEWADFNKWVKSHIVDGTVVDSDHIVPNTDGNTFFDQKYPTIAVKAGTSWKFPDGYSIEGLDSYQNELTAIIIPPINNFTPYNGTLAVSAVDYTNKKESSPSNIITIG